MVMSLIYGELERMWKEAAVACFEVSSRNSAGEAEEDHKISYFSQDSNLAPPKYELPPELTCSVLSRSTINFADETFLQPPDRFSRCALT
jgi:hypothetical protein